MKQIKIANVFDKSAKSLAVLSVFGVLSVSADADVADLARENLEGFNAGLDLMYNNANIKHTVHNGSVVINGNRLFSTKESDVDHKGCALAPVLNLGYSALFGNWYTGLSGEVAFSKDFKREEALLGTVLGSKIAGFSYGVKAKGGYYIENFKAAVYGIAGIRMRDVELSSYSPMDFSKAKLSKPAVVLGIGVEKAFCKKLSVCAEYEYSWRKSSDNMTANRPSTLNANVSAVANDVKQNFRESSFRLGFKYHI